MPESPTKNPVLQPDDATKQILIRRNVGRPCPHCHMPLSMGKYVTSDPDRPYPQFAYYGCAGYTDPETKIRYAGCNGTFKLRVIDETEALALLAAGRQQEVEEHLKSTDRSLVKKKLATVKSDAV